MLQYPLLAFLDCDDHFSCSPRHQIARLFSNLDIGRGAAQKGRVEVAEELVDLAARAGNGIGTKEHSSERDLGDGELR
jgi:hypothetical protein